MPEDALRVKGPLVEDSVNTRNEAPEGSLSGPPKGDLERRLWPQQTRQGSPFLIENRFHYGMQGPNSHEVLTYLVECCEKPHTAAAMAFINNFLFPYLKSFEPARCKGAAGVRRTRSNINFHPLSKKKRERERCKPPGYKKGWSQEICSEQWKNKFLAKRLGEGRRGR
ncbi:hypothetical protein CEXT_195201 [Caerostris extrusa]|uniref:Uncharacterized protein n=1 Tax=Caerostris extrusa TaxID=172846 RepID=A0AAV4M9I0_CAEEX|nr:hypothetical protein CEXT_195201 [Caerostris extrusa]